PAFLAAIEASLADQQIGGQHTTENQSVNTILKLFQEETVQQTSDECESCNIIISRKAVLQSALRAIERKTFSFFEPVTITSGEDAVDVGGPRSRILSPSHGFFECIRCFPWCMVFHDLHQLNNRKYALTGKLVAWSILQGCNGPRCLSEEGYNLCRGVAVEPVTAIEDIADVDMREILRTMEASTSEEDFAEIITKSADQIAQYGYSKIYTAKLANKR
ncbi:hypothetical protein OS493_012265, partial [Desmophyllum pertusum]